MKLHMNSTSADTAINTHQVAHPVLCSYHPIINTIITQIIMAVALQMHHTLPCVLVWVTGQGPVLEVTPLLSPLPCASTQTTTTSNLTFLVDQVGRDQALAHTPIHRWVRRMADPCRMVNEGADLGMGTNTVQDQVGRPPTGGIPIDRSLHIYHLVHLFLWVGVVDPVTDRDVGLRALGQVLGCQGPDQVGVTS